MKRIVLILSVVLVPILPDLAWAGRRECGTMVQAYMILSFLIMVLLLLSSCCLIIGRFIEDRRRKRAAKCPDRRAPLFSRNLKILAKARADRDADRMHGLPSRV
jgi:uncharacterized membrane protein